MSEQGWRDFLETVSLKDWVVLHGGATAVFRVASGTHGARLAIALVEIPEFSASGALLTISGHSVTVRLTRDVWQLEANAIHLGQAISSVAQLQGAIADRSAVQEVQIAIAAKREMVHLEFWRAILGYAPMADDNAVDPLGHSSTVWMQEIAPEKSLRHAMHLDVSVAKEHVQSRLQAALAAGGTIVDDSHAPSHWTLSDRAGNRVCICAWPDGSTL
jgi:4a-hydroxytetrahydrobiopterin dehydratase